MLQEAEGGVQKNLKGSSLLRLTIPVPPLPEQRGILSVVKANEDQLSSEMASLDKLRLLKQGLMDDLLTGRVRVSAVT